MLKPSNVLIYSHTPWCGDLLTLLLLYKTFVRSILNHDCFFCTSATSSTLNSLQTIQNLYAPYEQHVICLKFLFSRQMLFFRQTFSLFNLWNFTDSHRALHAYLQIPLKFTKTILPLYSLNFTPFSITISINVELFRPLNSIPYPRQYYV